MISAKNVTKKYGNKSILKNFNYKFSNGVYLIRGKSGKGKTTLLNILSLNDTDKEGEIKVEGSIFYIRDRNNLVNDLTVREHFKLFEKINNKRIESLFDLKKIYNKKIKKLSLGERQLVLLTLALNSSEDNLILDEPFSALSKENLKKACSFLEKESKRKTIIIATHNEPFFCEYVDINLNRRNSKEIVLGGKGDCEISKKGFRYRYLMLYYKKTIFKKLFFALSLVSTILSFFYMNTYLEKSFNEYLSYFKAREGAIVEKKNTVNNINENLFYEVVKKISSYVIDYNVNYYNVDLYKYDLKVDKYYIDNAFVFSSIKYIEEDLKDNEIVLGINYKDFCSNNAIFSCDNDYVNSVLINKELSDLPYVVSRVFFSDETVVLSNKRFFKLYENNEYEEYYFDIKKEDKENLYKIINEEDLLMNFEFTLIGENELYLRYKVEVKEYKYFKEVNYDKYLVCLDKGYDCFNYLNHFDSLISIDNFNEIEKVDMKVVQDDLMDKEIIISSSLAKKIKKREGETISFYFEYKGEVKRVDFYVKKIIKNEDYYIYQNSKWSYSLFKDILKFGESDLRIKNIVIYEELKEEDNLSDDLYNDVLKDFMTLVGKMKKSIFYISLFLSFISVSILVVLELFQNKFKREYFRYLELLNIKKGTMVP